LLIFGNLVLKNYCHGWGLISYNVDLNSQSGGSDNSAMKTPYQTA